MGERGEGGCDVEWYPVWHGTGLMGLAEVETRAGGLPRGVVVMVVRASRL